MTRRHAKAEPRFHLNRALGGKRLAIIQYRHGGHRLIYVRHVIHNNPEGTSPLVFLTEDAVASWEYEHHLSDAVAESGAELIVLPTDMTERSFVIAAIDHCVAKAGVHLVIPDADHALSTLLRLPRRDIPAARLSYLVMRTPMGSSKDRTVTASKYALAALLKMKFRDRISGRFLTDSFGVVQRDSLRLLLAPSPDPYPGLPAATREAARAHLAIPTNAFVIGILGSVSERKHPEVALGALQLLPSDHAVLLAGELSEGVRRNVASLDDAARRRLIVLDRQLSDAELSMAVHACDAVALLHDLDGPSGMLVNAAVAGVPVVAGVSPWLRRVVAIMGLGPHCAHTPASLVSALQDLAQRPPTLMMTDPATAADFVRSLLCDEARRPSPPAG